MILIAASAATINTTLGLSLVTTLVYWCGLCRGWASRMEREGRL